MENKESYKLLTLDLSLKSFMILLILTYLTPTDHKNISILEELST